MAGNSYSIARDWFRMPGFPVFRGVVFWQNYAQWRICQYRSRAVAAIADTGSNGDAAPRNTVSLPAGAARMLLEA